MLGIITRLPLAMRLALLSFMMNLAIEASGVFMPLYARSVGASNLQVGVIAATYGLTFFAASILFGRLSDMNGRLAFIRGGLGISVLAYFSQTLATSPLQLMASRAFIGFSLGVTSAAVMAYTFEKQKQIGSFASYGSLGWLAGAILAGLLQDFHTLFITSAGASLIAFVTAWTLAEVSHGKMSLPLLPLPVFKENRKVYLAFFARQLGANAIWAIFALYLAGIGASRQWVAIIDGINMAGQFVAMRFLDRFNPAKVFRVGLMMSAGVFILYSLATSYLQLIPVQVVLAVSWACLYVGALNEVLRRSREHGTASGLLYSTMYLSAGVGPFIGGGLSQAWGFDAVMLFGSGMAVSGYFLSAGRDHTHKKEVERSAGRVGP